MLLDLHPVFDKAEEGTRDWIKEITLRLEWSEPRAMKGLRAVLHAIRDQLTIDQTARLGDHLPLVLRGFYYEKWHPRHLTTQPTIESFLSRVRAEFPDGDEDEINELIRGVLDVLSLHISENEHVRLLERLPSQIRSLWMGCPA